MTVDLKWVRSGDTLIAALLGRIDSGSAEDFQRLLEEGLGPDDHNLVLDFERVAFIGSAGLRVCLIIARRFTGPDRQFGLCSLSRFNRDIVAVSGFDRIINVCDSRATAIESFANG